MRIEVGSRIKWVSKAGILSGVVKMIKLDLNAANQTIPWLTVMEIVDQNNERVPATQLPGTDSYFAMMKLEVLR